MTNVILPRWYVAQTQPSSERKASHHLERQGFPTYLPCYLKRRRHAGRTDVVAAPLFARYLFVSVDIGAQRWRSINSTIGVARLVCNGEDPAPVPAEVIDALKAREDGRGLIQLDQRPRFVPGDKVRILEGAFDSCLGLFERMSDSERVAILLDLLGRKVRVMINQHAIAAA